MRFETDQSGRIEETSRDTVVAIANKSQQFSLRVPARTKHALQREYTNLGKPKLFAYKTFAEAIALLIKKSKLKIDVLIIDIRFKKIGKSSPAHAKAYFTFRDKLKEDFEWE